MAKIIKYQYAYEVFKEELVQIPYYDEEAQQIYYIEKYEPKIHLEFSDMSLICPTEEGFYTNLLIAQREAYNGEYTIEGEFDT